MKSAIVLVGLGLIHAFTGHVAGVEKRNVLLICVDDLKPALGCYGDKLAKTPNIDRLASRGMRFDRAYCNQAVCAPSRNNLLVGVRSTTLGIYSLGDNFRIAAPQALTLPQYFMRNGWRAEAVGKLFHTGHGNHDDAASWSVPSQPDKVVEYFRAASSANGRLTREEAFFSNQKLGQNQTLPRGAAWEIADAPDNAYADGRIADEGIRRLRSAKERSGQPFFLALGFVKPHLPFTAPKKYWDLHDRAAFPLAAHTSPPTGAPPYAGKTLGELNQYEPIPQTGPLSDELQRTLIHGYYAAASYMDAQIGRVLDELDRLGLADNTLIVLWGDHGWHLGDHGAWTKHTNYEQANRIPLLVVAPGVAQPGSHTQQLAESVDIYPTLAELAGLPRPDVSQKLDGASLMPVLRDGAARVRDHAYHAFPRQRAGKPVIGRAIRSERHRLVEWKAPGAPPETADIELYDYDADPAESQNLAASQPEVVAKMRAILARHPEAKPAVKQAAKPKAETATASARPNIVVFLSDDHSQLDSTPYGSQALRTPNMQRLAASGLTFTRAYVASPSCAPSRAALLTGLMPARNGAEANHSKPRAELKKWPAYFQALGYEVAAFGKVSHYKHTADYGFDHFANDSFHDHAGIPAAVEYLKSRDRTKPLCLFVGSNWPHVPWPDKDLGYDPADLKLPAGSVDTPATRAWRARYAAAVTRADDDLGRIFTAAQETLGEQTLFLMSADHGAQWPFAKWNCYEAGVCVPLIASWPGKIKPGTRSAALVSWVDLLPTLLAAAGGNPPNDIDGRSFLPVLRGESDEHRDRIFTTHAGDGRWNIYPARSVRLGDWKLIRNLHPEFAFTSHIDLPGTRENRAFWASWETAGKTDPAAAAIVARYHARPALELYDLASDPHEQRNLAADPAHAARLKSLQAELERWMNQQGDRQSVFAPPRLLSAADSYGPNAVPGNVPAGKKAGK